VNLISTTICPKCGNVRQRSLEPFEEYKCLKCSYFPLQTVAISEYKSTPDSGSKPLDESIELKAICIVNNYLCNKILVGTNPLPIEIARGIVRDLKPYLSVSKPLDEVKAEFYKKMGYFTAGKNSEKIKGFWLDEESLDVDGVWNFFKPYLSEGGHDESK
jgi:hypothetical protein